MQAAGKVSARTSLGLSAVRKRSVEGAPAGISVPKRAGPEKGNRVRRDAVDRRSAAAVSRVGLEILQIAERFRGWNESELEPLLIEVSPRPPAYRSVGVVVRAAVGYMMVDGVFRQMVLRPLSLSRPYPGKGWQEAAGSWPRFIG